MALKVIGGTEEKSGISRLTTEYIYWPIISDDDFLGTTASVAFKTGTGKPAPGDFNSAEVVPNPDDPTGQAVRCLVGPELTGVDLSPATAEPATYRVWVRLATGSENIVRLAGNLVVR